MVRLKLCGELKTSFNLSALNMRLWSLAFGYEKRATCNIWLLLRANESRKRLLPPLASLPLSFCMKRHKVIVFSPLLSLFASLLQLAACSLQLATCNLTDGFTISILNLWRVLDVSDWSDQCSQPVNRNVFPDYHSAENWLGLQHWLLQGFKSRSLQATIATIFAT